VVGSFGVPGHLRGRKRACKYACIKISIKARDLMIGSFAFLGIYVVGNVLANMCTLNFA